jgi:hypothetical protein
LVKFQQRYEKRHGNYAAGRVSVSRSLVRPILNAGNLWCSKAAHTNLKSCSFRFDNERIPVQSCTRLRLRFLRRQAAEFSGNQTPKIGCLNGADNWGCHLDIIPSQRRAWANPYVAFVRSSAFKERLVCLREVGLGGECSTLPLLHAINWSRKDVMIQSLRGQGRRKM